MKRKNGQEKKSVKKQTEVQDDNVGAVDDDWLNEVEARKATETVYWHHLALRAGNKKKNGGTEKYFI